MSKAKNTQKERMLAFDELAKLLAVDLTRESVDAVGARVLALAKLSAKTPQFSSPLRAWDAQRIRDRVLAAAGIEEPL